MKFRIVNVQACDLFTVENGEVVSSGYSLKYTNDDGEERNCRWKYTGMLDDSMLNDMLIKIVKRGDVVTRATFGNGSTKYTNQVIQLKFNFSVTVKETRELKKGKNKGEVKEVTTTVLNRENLRKKVYNEGVTIDGIHYVRWMRSGGSSRIGTCLFINEVLLNSMNLKSNAGVNIKEDEIDLASFEAYRSLMLSTNIGYIEIKPENILLVDDYESIFTENCNVTTLYNKHLYTKQSKVEVRNSIWDGQSLIDKSLLGEYSEHGMVLLRNLMFKSCCFNTNIQTWFADNNITSVDQLNGKTLAKNISDIKLITTESSIKYKKFGTENWFKDWLGKIGSQFGVVKYDKPTKHEKGTMVRTHYQLMNTLNLSEEEISKLIEPSINRINEVVESPEQMLDYCSNYVNEDSLSMQTKRELVVRLLKLNPEIGNTEFYAKIVDKIKNEMRGDIKKGKILINGNYSTLCGNPIEMLQQAIGTFKGKSVIGIGKVVTKRMEHNKNLLVCRSPHITMGNIYLPVNNSKIKIKGKDFFRYMNFTDEIIGINSIEENTLQRLQGCDFDSDTGLITDNEILINAAKKYYKKFNVPFNAVESHKLPKQYTMDNLAELDHRTSVNLIGEIVNLSQLLNSIYWNTLSDKNFVGDRAKTLREIYKDICTLSVMSGLEIDKAKKFFDMDSEVELKEIRKKYINNSSFPAFFEYLDRSKNRKQQREYQNYDTTMDNLYRIIKNMRLSTCNAKEDILDYIYGNSKKSNINMEQVELIINACVKRVTANIAISKESNGYDYKVIADEDFYNDFKEISKKRISISTIRYCIKEFRGMKASNALTEYLLLGLLSEKQETAIRILTPSKKIQTSK